MDYIEGAEFEKNKTVLALNLVFYLNRQVFDNRLPFFEIKWSTRLSTTAGRVKCAQKVIELSYKIVINTNRLKEVLAHELCHAAVWFIDSNYLEKHGNLFKKWANRCTQICGIEVTITHEYLLRAWKCNNCDFVVLSNHSLKSFYHKLCGCYHFIEIPYNDKTKGIKLNKTVNKEHLIKVIDDINFPQLNVPNLPQTPHVSQTINLPSPPALPSVDKNLYLEFIKFQ